MRAKSGFGRAVGDAWERIPPIVRDVGIAVFVIMILMSGLWLYTGQPLNQAPLVVVESGSMMHDGSPWGRLGTIDPGDLILVKDVDEADPFDVVTMYGARAGTTDGHPGEGKREGYGEPGDVVIYKQDQCPRRQDTPIIHRAITWVEVTGSQGNYRYAYHTAAGEWVSGRDSVDLPEISVSDNDRFARSGWITKGDNTVTNRPADQVGICNDLLIQPDWVIGKARGEIPWVGLLKFIVQGNNVNNPPPDWCTPFKAVAPCDLFQALFLSLFVLVAVPLVWDVVHRMRKQRSGFVDEDDEDRPPPSWGAPPEGAPPPRPPPARPRPRPRSEAEARKAPGTGRPRWAPPDDDDERRDD